MWRSNRAGFTLIELMIGLTLWAITAITLAHLFQSGLHLWKRLENVTLFQQEARGVLEQIARDVRQNMDVPGVGWSASGDRVSFATLDRATIVKVTYQMNLNALERQTQLLSPDGRHEPVTTVLTQQPASLKWEYAYVSLQAPLVWRDDWKGNPDAAIPCGVRVHLTLYDVSASSETFIKTIFVPVTKPLPWAV